MFKKNIIKEINEDKISLISELIFLDKNTRSKILDDLDM